MARYGDGSITSWAEGSAATMAYGSSEEQGWMHLKMGGNLGKVIGLCSLLCKFFLSPIMCQLQGMKV